MNGSFFGVSDIILILVVAILNFSFANMWQILYGNWHKMTPIWKWFDEFKALKKLSKTTNSDDLKRKCKITFYGIYLSIGLILFAIIVEGLRQ